MEQTLVYSAIQAAEDSIEKEDQIEKEGQIECKELIINIPDEPKEPSRWPDCCIYRVPKRLREVRKRAYTPRLVSIGPFHYCMRKYQFKDMEQQKIRYFWYFCKRTMKSNKDLACIIQRKEDKIRHCYSENFRLDCKEYVKMILLDAVFILELFLRKYDLKNSKTDEKDYILSQPCMERGIQHDLLLLENQIPFFILEELYQNWDPKKKKPTLIELSCGFFVDLICYGWKPESKKCGHVKQCVIDLVGCCCHLQVSNPSSPDPRQPFIEGLEKYFYRDQQNQSSQKPENEVKHLTDLVRYFFCPPKAEGQKSKSKNNKHLHGTATKLDEAGLKFTKSDSERGLLQIQFPGNICLETFPCFNLSWLLSCLPCLKIPPLLLDDKTEGLFRNLMALEQCHYPFETYICDYIVLLDDLITTKDVRFLSNANALNELGSSAAVTKLINNLALEIEESGNPDYETLCEKVNDYYKSPWNRLVGILTTTYFSDFFKGTATVVGIIVLVLTLWNFQRLIRLSA
ncbi:hypothetical protein I3843_14G024900 [Carya illinoinensis]|nr:hypothetical protein I3843_14G024900 [Carya illinoinensis]